MITSAARPALAGAVAVRRAKLTVVAVLETRPPIRPPSTAPSFAPKNLYAT